MRRERRPDELPSRESLSWPRRVGLWCVETQVGKAETWIAAIWIGAAGVFLGLAWVSGPQRAFDASNYKAFTGHVSGTIVESWVALELDPGQIANAEFWRASARVSPCVIVEYHGDWSTGAAQRAFCGSRLKFSSEYLLAEVREVTASVPFAWPRDARGFIVPQMRLDERAYGWLEALPPVDTFLYRKRPAKSILDELRFDLDDPVDAAVAGWLATPASIPLAYDPRHPDRALPDAVIAERINHGTNWIAFLGFALLGVLTWVKGMTTLPIVAELAAPVRWVLIVSGLAALPWWGTYLPRTVAYLNPQIAGVIRDMLADDERTNYFVDSIPEDALLRDGRRLTWDTRSGPYAEVFSLFRLRAPTLAPRDPDAALKMLAVDITSQVAALDDDRKVQLFAWLARDVASDLDHAAVAFLPAARETVLAGSKDEGPARAARRFLEAWSAKQHLHAHGQLARSEREELAKSVAGMP